MYAIRSYYVLPCRVTSFRLLSQLTDVQTTSADTPPAFINQIPCLLSDGYLNRVVALCLDAGCDATS